MKPYHCVQANYYFYSLRVVHISVIWWYFIEVCDNKSPKISRTLLSILADLNNAVVYLVSACPLISKSSVPCINPLVTKSRALISIGIIVIFMFHSFVSSLARSRYLSFFSLSFNVSRWSAGRAKSAILEVLYFLLVFIRSGCLAKLRWSVYISKSKRSLCVSFSRTLSLLLLL